MFQWKMAILMCPLDKKTKQTTTTNPKKSKKPQTNQQNTTTKPKNPLQTDIDHSSSKQYRNQATTSSTLVNTADELPVQNVHSIQLHPSFWILN